MVPHKQNHSSLCRLTYTCALKRRWGADVNTWKKTSCRLTSRFHTGLSSSLNGSIANGTASAYTRCSDAVITQVRK